MFLSFAPMLTLAALWSLCKNPGKYLFSNLFYLPFIFILIILFLALFQASYPIRK